MRDELTEFACSENRADCVEAQGLITHDSSLIAFFGFYGLTT